MSETLRGIGVIAIILGLAFGIGYIASFIPGAINGVIEFAKTYWWITIIVGVAVFLIGVKLEKK